MFEIILASTDSSLFPGDFFIRPLLATRLVGGKIGVRLLNSLLEYSFI